MTETDERDRLRKKKKRKQQGTSSWLVIGIVAGVLLLIGGVVLAVALNLPRQDKDAQAKGGPEQKPAGPEKEAPLPRLNPQAKGVIQNVRNAAYRPQRLNELRTIAQFFTQFNAEFNRNPRSEDEFLMYIQREAPTIAEALREKYYVLNLKARVPSSESVVAFEALTEANGHQTARGDGAVTLLAPDELQRMLMQ